VSIQQSIQQKYFEVSGCCQLLQLEVQVPVTESSVARIKEESVDESCPLVLFYVLWCRGGRVDLGGCW